MKIINFFSTSKLNNLFLFNFILFLFTYFFISLSPSLISSVQPDSQTYLDFDMTRTSIYPYLINVLNTIKLDLFIFQKLLLALSIIFLIYSLKKRKISNRFVILFYIAIILNFFYTSFSKTILTESVFFSFTNISIAIFLLNKNNNYIFNFVLGISIGFIVSLKSIGFALGLTLIIILFIYFLNQRILRNFFIILSGFFIILILENYLFFKSHNQRKSVLPISIVGKVFFLSGKDSFNVQNFPERFRDIINESKSSFRPVLLFLEGIKNPILKADLTADYEVVAQYQFLKFKIPQEKKFNERKIFDHSNELLKSLLKYNFKEYFILSMTHYFGMWSTNSKEIFLKKYLEKNLIKQPLEEAFRKSSGGIKTINSNLLFLTQSLFLGIFVFFILLSLYSIISF